MKHTIEKLGETLPSHDEYDGADSIDRFATNNGISRSQAYKELASGRLVGRKVGSRTIITREDAAAWRRALPKMSAKAAEPKEPASTSPTASPPVSSDRPDQVKSTRKRAAPEHHETAAE